MGFSHLEPLSIPPGFYNAWLAPMTAAWMKIYLGASQGGLDPKGAYVRRLRTIVSPLLCFAFPPSPPQSLADFCRRCFTCRRFHSMIYNASNPVSLCNYAEMADCQTIES